MAVSRELSDFFELLEKHKELNEALASPFIPAGKKKQIAEEILAEKSMTKKTLRFLLLLVENARLELLPDILASLPERWNEKKGIYTFEVASVVPLSVEQKSNLEKRLERLEKRPVVLKYRIDPELVGGLWIKRGNIVYDVSMKGSLMKVKERIIEG